MRIGRELEGKCPKAPAASSHPSAATVIKQEATDKYTEARIYSTLFLNLTTFPQVARVTDGLQGALCRHHWRLLALFADETATRTVWIIIFNMLNPIIWQSFYLMVSAGSLHWFHRRSGHSRDPLWIFQLAPRHWSIVLPPRGERAPATGMNGKHHHLAVCSHGATWLSYCEAELWFQTVEEDADRRSRISGRKVFDRFWN